jgi:hypothetical protein
MQENVGLRSTLSYEEGCRPTGCFLVYREGRHTEYLLVGRKQEDVGLLGAFSYVEGYKPTEYTEYGVPSFVHDY